MDEESVVPSGNEGGCRSREQDVEYEQAGGGCRLYDDEDRHAGNDR
jgi:hypothetical protein